MEKKKMNLVEIINRLKKDKEDSIVKMEAFVKTEEFKQITKRLDEKIKIRKSKLIA